MSPSVLVASALVSIAVAVGAVAVSALFQPARAQALGNLNRGRVAAAAEGSQPSALDAFARRVTLPAIISSLERQHARAGRPATWPIDRLLLMKLLWVPSAFMLLLIVLVTGQQSILSLVVLVVGVVVYFLPDLLLVSRGQERAQKIELELADTLDQMTIAVEAGLGFDAAMARAAANGKGAMAEEFTRTLQDIRMGVSRRAAFEELASRNQVPDLKHFVRALLQADANGISVGDVLRTQAAEMRMKRRQRAEAKAQQVPVKVLFPLMLCILPVLFIIVMTPAVMDLVETFSKI